MSDIAIWHNPSCATSRNTLALIRNSGAEPRIVLYLNTPPSGAELLAALARMEMPLRALLRRKGTPHAALGLDTPVLSDADLLAAIAEHPILINRPVVFTPLGARLCRPSETVLDLLPNPQRGAFAKEDGEQVVDAAGERPRRG